MLLQPKCVFIEKFSVPASKRISLAIGKDVMWALGTRQDLSTVFLREHLRLHRRKTL